MPMANVSLLALLGALGALCATEGMPTGAQGNLPCFAGTPKPASPTKNRDAALGGLCRKDEIPVARRLFDDEAEGACTEAEGKRRRGAKLQDLPAWASGPTNPTAVFPDMPADEAMVDDGADDEVQQDTFAMEESAEESRFSVEKIRNSMVWSMNTGIEVMLGVRAWLELRMRSALDSKVGHFLSHTLPTFAKRMLPSQTTRKSIQELAYLSASVWAEALCRIVKYQLSVVLHALWRQGLVIAHSFSRLCADSSIVVNTPVLERRRAELRAKTAAHDVKSYRARVAHLRSQMEEATHKLQEAEQDALDAARRLGGSQRDEERRGNSVTRVSLRSSPRLGSSATRGENFAFERTKTSGGFCMA